MDTPQQPSPEAAALEPIPADFLVRGGAVAIDAFIVGLAQTLARFVLSLIHLPDLLVRLVLFLLGASYFTYMIGACEGQTIGKRTAGIAVVRGDLSPVDLVRAGGRYLATLLSGFILGIGYLVALFTRNKRALHDMLADTRVIYAVEITPTRKRVMSALGLLIPLLAVLAIAAAVILPTAARLGGAQLPGAAGTVSAPADLPDLVLRSKEGTNQANLRLLRSLSSRNGSFAPDLKSVFPQGDMKETPMLQLASHGDTNEVQNYGAEACAGKDGVNPAGLKDTGRWGYVSDRSAPCWGRVFVDCTHPDSTGKPWASY